jgi:hypothetical protein
MRVSEHFGLLRRQPHLDFVDVDVTDDIPLFVDPRALLLLPSPWAQACVEMVKDFFNRVLRAIQDQKHDEAKTLLAGLSEPNETHLGLSIGASRGRAVGRGRAAELWDALRQSEAVHRGLIEEIEDTVLLVPGIGPDIVSDITTNVIREPLIEYTQAACQAYGIPMDPEVASGRLWDPANERWFEKLVQLPVANQRRLLLVPKSIVRQRFDYDVGEYFNHYILTILQQEELDANSSLVQVLKNNKRRVTKKDLKKKYGSDRSVIVDQTIRHPDALRQYREDHREVTRPLPHEQLAVDANDIPNYNALLGRLHGIPTGREDATEYEAAIEDLLYALFYPALTSPERQVQIHQGRKRIDIAFQNVAGTGFFRFLSLHAPCPFVFVECKNYSGDPANPELDQLTGRFSPQRGRVGLLVCRTIQNKQLFVQRCRDTAQDDRGWVIPLDDNDLGGLLQERQNQQQPIDFPLLLDRFKQVLN